MPFARRRWSRALTPEDKRERAGVGDLGVEPLAAGIGDEHPHPVLPQDGRGLGGRLKEQQREPEDRAGGRPNRSYVSSSAVRT